MNFQLILRNVVTKIILITNLKVHIWPLMVLINSTDYFHDFNHTKSISCTQSAVQEKSILGSTVVHNTICLAWYIKTILWALDYQLILSVYWYSKPKKYYAWSFAPLKSTLLKKWIKLDGGKFKSQINQLRLMNHKQNWELVFLYCWNIMHS